MSITSISIEINGEKTEMKLDEAKKLYRELKELFDKTFTIPYTPSQPTKRDDYWWNNAPWTKRTTMYCTTVGADS